MMKIMMSVLMLVFLCGCVSMGRKIDESAAGQIEKGKTTKQQVIGLLGSPDQMTTRGDGSTVFIYSYTRATAKPATFIPIVGPLVGGANVQHQMFMVTFTPDGVVKDYINSQGGTELDQGLATGGHAATPEVEANKRPK